MIFETNEPLHPHLMFPSHFPLTADGISEMDLVGIATIRPSASSHHLQTSSFIRRIPCSFNLLMKIKSILRVKYSLDLNLSRMKMREWWWMSNKRHNRAAKMKEKCQNIYKLSNGAWFCCRFGRLVETLHEWITEESAKNFVVILKFVFHSSTKLMITLTSTSRRVKLFLSMKRCDFCPKRLWCRLIFLSNSIQSNSIVSFCRGQYFLFTLDKN